MLPIFADPDGQIIFAISQSEFIQDGPTKPSLSGDATAEPRLQPTSPLRVRAPQGSGEWAPRAKVAAAAVPYAAPAPATTEPGTDEAHDDDFAAFATNYHSPSPAAEPATPPRATGRAPQGSGELLATAEPGTTAEPDEDFTAFATNYHSPSPRAKGGIGRSSTAEPATPPRDRAPLGRRSSGEPADDEDFAAFAQQYHSPSPRAKAAATILAELEPTTEPATTSQHDDDAERFAAFAEAFHSPSRPLSPVARSAKVLTTPLRASVPRASVAVKAATANDDDAFAAFHSSCKKTRNLRRVAQFSCLLANSYLTDICCRLTADCGSV